MNEPSIPTQADDDTSPIDAERRRLLAGIAATGVALGSASSAAARTVADVELPPPTQSGIDHFVVVMMENRSFDHLLGWVPNADGLFFGLGFRDANGTLQATHDLAPDYQNCASEVARVRDVWRPRMRTMMRTEKRNPSWTPPRSSWS
ncbi:MAG: hypothetical protein JSR59_18625 [Proteobacteria bacterium]|nr:hypothetical protein [Pseudomonadota bacterium]